MMKKCLILMCLLLVPVIAQAAEKTKKPEPLLPAKECQYLVAYQPNVDGDAEYKPGVDVHGEPVVEADMSSSVIMPPEKISFDVTVDLAEYLGLSVPGGLENKAKMGTITYENGQILFNDKPLESKSEAALKALCSEKDKEPAKPEKKAK